MKKKWNTVAEILWPKSVSGYVKFFQSILSFKGFLNATKTAKIPSKPHENRKKILETK